MSTTNNCPCGSGREYAVCCEPYLKGTLNPPTAEALMRSRYTAYVRHEISYIADTYDPELREDLNLEETRKWAETSEWLGLKIHRTEKGGESDDEGIVEFTVSYNQKGLHYDHNEKSFFKKTDGRWYFVEGAVDHGTVVRTGDKTGRNDPCPCGSGKKYKKCCGA